MIPKRTFAIQTPSEIFFLFFVDSRVFWRGKIGKILPL